MDRDFGAEMGADEPARAPSGTRIAFDKQSYASVPFLGIWTMRADGTGKKKVDGTGFDPAWQPR